MHIYTTKIKRYDSYGHKNKGLYLMILSPYRLNWIAMNMKRREMCLTFHYSIILTKEKQTEEDLNTMLLLHA